MAWHPCRREVGVLALWLLYENRGSSMDRMQKKWRRSPESRGRSVRRNLSADCAWYASSPAIRLPSRVETIDTTSPNVASWCAQLCERAEAAGVEVAYFLMVPSFEPGGARLAAAATPRVQLMVDACKTLRPEVSAAIGRGFSVAEPTLWRPDILSAGMPPALRRARQAWIAWAAEAWGSRSTTASMCRCSALAVGAASSRSARPSSG